MVLVIVWYNMVLILVWYWYWYGIGMHIIANAYHSHPVVCNGIGIGMQCYGIGIGIVIGMQWYGIGIGISMVLVLVFLGFTRENLAQWQCYVELYLILWYGIGMHIIANIGMVYHTHTYIGNDMVDQYLVLVYQCHTNTNTIPILILVSYWYCYGIGMHIIANAYLCHVMVCKGIGIGTQWYAMVLVFVWYVIGIGMVLVCISLSMHTISMQWYAMVWIGMVFVKYLYQICKYTSIIPRINHKPFTIT
jgi:hypothetical protein